MLLSVEVYLTIRLEVFKDSILLIPLLVCRSGNDQSSLKNVLWVLCLSLSFIQDFTITFRYVYTFYDKVWMAVKFFMYKW